MPLATALLGCVVLAILGICLLLETRFHSRQESRRDHRLHARGPTTTPELMAQFYNNTAVTPRDIDFVRHSIAKAANIADPEWIHPSDRLLKDLGPWRFDELGTVELVMAMEEALGTEIRNREAERFVTVDDLIRRLSNRPRTPRA